jgi:hypothetical protein
MFPTWWTHISEYMALAGLVVLSVAGTALLLAGVVQAALATDRKR